MSHFVAYILQFQEIIVYKIPPGGRGSIASLRSIMAIYIKRTGVTTTVLHLVMLGMIHRLTSDVNWMYEIDVYRHTPAAGNFYRSCR